MCVHQFLLNNTLLSLVSNKLLIVLFDEVVYSIYCIAGGFHHCQFSILFSSMRLIN